MNIKILNYQRSTKDYKGLPMEGVGVEINCLCRWFDSFGESKIWWERFGGGDGVECGCIISSNCFKSSSVPTSIIVGGGWNIVYYYLYLKL